MIPTALRDGEIEEWDADLRSADPLTFPGYARSLAAGRDESTRTGLAETRGQQVVFIDLAFERMSGTMGAAAGEKIVRAFDRAIQLHLPVVATISTGGARLQEGMVALVQMGRTVSARRRHARAGLPMVAVYGSPTTGGVFASWASLADLRAAVAGATVGFGGPRVVEAVTGQLPPKTSHTAESALLAGIVDAVVAPHEVDAWIECALGLSDQRLTLPSDRTRVENFIGSSHLPMTAWETVCAARAPERPSGLEWAAALTTSWCDLAAPDPAIRAGIAILGGQRVVIIAMDRHARGDAAARPGPLAYRTAQRAISLAGQLRLPLVTLIDTPGAEPGPQAEASGIAGEIARTLDAIASATVVTISICVGEGGSGGAIALGYTDRAFILEGAVFSVIGPEAAGAILERDPARAPAMADALRITANELVTLGVLDESLSEPGPHAVDAARRAILDGLSQARVGDRETRNSLATLRSLRRVSVSNGSLSPGKEDIAAVGLIPETTVQVR